MTCATRVVNNNCSTTAEEHEATQRQALGRQRFLATDSQSRQIRDKALAESVIPTSHLQSRSGERAETEMTTTLSGLSGAAGWYRGPAARERPDMIAVDPREDQGYPPTHTFVHEAGHRRHIGETTGMSPINHPSQINPDPLKEGVADAYADRFGGQN